MNTRSHPMFDALLPAVMALKAEEIGVRKAGMDAGRTFALSVLAGAFISLARSQGATLSTSECSGRLACRHTAR